MGVFLLPTFLSQPIVPPTPELWQYVVTSTEQKKRQKQMYRAQAKTDILDYPHCAIPILYPHAHTHTLTLSPSSTVSTKR